MPEPGDPCPGFIVEHGRCWQMVYDRNLQAAHCREAAAWAGRWRSPRGDRWWIVWAFQEHVEGLREFARRR